ncbi:tetrathionate reductase family octaheme c-type cytochrome [bacterium]|nr:tetrathionate reductase family octaheme c-type cytochrome [bacterium]
MRITAIALLLLFWAGSIAAQDHADFIEGPFDSPQEITETCLTCHEDVGEEVMETEHWTWLGPEFEDGEHGVIQLGKQRFINNFCIAIPSNWPRCTSCHIGYGWKDASFDFDDPNNIDCLVCHDQSGTYKKTPTAAGMPDEDVDLVTVAQSVGLPTRRNCGVCHFDGGGGSGVKHGDLDDSMYEPSEELDVHMGGMDFGCTECHTTDAHHIAGAGHSSMATNSNHIACTDCHDAEVHEKSLLNDHVKTLACESCHVPTFAREEPTKVWWDWSKAGEDREGSEEQFGRETYNKKKGEFVWKKNVVPTYVWSNGGAEYYVMGDRIDPKHPVALNHITGSIKEVDARIAPFKVMRGKQPYDTGNATLIVPHLFGKDGYWKTFDWDSASRKGMESAGLPYTGSYAFVETEMYWPINHMVAPAKNALHCTSCHGKKGERRLDWKALGYSKDPITKGSRFKQGLVEEE